MATGDWLANAVTRVTTPLVERPGRARSSTQASRDLFSPPMETASMARKPSSSSLSRAWTSLASA